LSKMFKVRGIPTLVFLDGATGATITLEGREAMSEDDFLTQFPFRPKQVNVIQELGDSLRKPGGETVGTAAALQGKDVLGLYFSAHWCPPCQKFTPILSQKYTALKQAGKSVEVVFVSSDRDKEAFAHYHDTMTFLALPFEARGAKNTLSKHFKVEGIPTLVFVEAKTGTLITDSGRSEVDSNTFLEDFPYYPKSVNDIASNLSGIQDVPCLLILMEQAPAAVQDSTTKMLRAIADTELKRPEAERAVQKFFVACGGGPIDQIRSKCAYTQVSTSPQMLILDLDNEGAYYHPASAEVSPASVQAFLQQFASKSLTKRTFGQS